MSFEGKTVILRCLIRLLIQTGSNVVEVDFIVVDAYSPYQKVKSPSEGQVKEIMGNQSMARQCMVAAISHRPSTKSSTFTEWVS